MQNIGLLFIKMGQYNDACTSFEFVMQEKPDFKTGLFFNEILNLSSFFLKRRILIRKFCKDHLIDFDHQNIKTYFNYFLDSSLIGKNSIIYSKIYTINY